jgi:uncharacterized membrane protein
MLRLKWYHWTIIVVETLVFIAGITYPVVENPLRHLTIRYVLVNLTVGFIANYLIVATGVLIYRKTTSALRRTYDSLHQSVENSAWINRMLYGPDWRDEIET